MKFLLEMNLRKLLVELLRLKMMRMEMILTQKLQLVKKNKSMTVVIGHGEEALITVIVQELHQTTFYIVLI